MGDPTTLPLAEDQERWNRATKWVSAVTSALGSFPAMIGSIAVIIVWGLTGPIFGFSDTWQLVINTSTTIVTFIMVFVIQNTQNRDGRAIQTKLDAILEALERADDRLVGIEDLPEPAIKREQEKVRAQANGGSHSASLAPSPGGPSNGRSADGSSPMRGA